MTQAPEPTASQVADTDDGPGLARCVLGAFIGAIAFLTVMGVGIALIRIIMRPDDLMQPGSWQSATNLDVMAIMLSALGAFLAGFLARTVGGAGKAVAMLVVALLCATVVWGMLRTSVGQDMTRSAEDEGAMALRIVPGALWVWGVPVAAAIAALLGGRLGARVLHAFLGG